MQKVTGKLYQDVVSSTPCRVSNQKVKLRSANVRHWVICWWRHDKAEIVLKLTLNINQSIYIGVFI